MLPSILARRLKEGFIDHVETLFPMATPGFAGAIRRMLDQKGSFFH